jgi:dihydrofolate reductase
MSLDGYIADANGGFDWIVMDPDIDFAAMMARYDTLLMGRRTYEVTQAVGGGGGGDRMPGVTTVVVSRTLKQRDHPDVRIVSENWEDAVRELREKPGKDIWLFGGGELFRSLLGDGLVDGVDVHVGLHQVQQRRPGVVDHHGGHLEPFERGQPHLHLVELVRSTTEVHRGSRGKEGTHPWAIDLSSSPGAALAG